MMNDLNKALLSSCQTGDTAALQKLTSPAAWPDGKVDFNILLSVDSTPLMVAVAENQWEAARWLVEHGADVHAENAMGALVCNFINFEDLSSLRMINSLESIGFNPLHISSTGRSLLRCLVSYSQLKAASNLIARGADILQLDNTGESLIHEAVRASSSAMLEMLLKKGLKLDHGNMCDGWMSPLSFALGDPWADEGLLDSLIEQGASMIGDPAFPEAIDLGSLLNLTTPANYSANLVEYCIEAELRKHELSDLLPLAKTIAAVRRLQEAFDLDADDLFELAQQQSASNGHYFVDAMVQ